MNILVIHSQAKDQTSFISEREKISQENVIVLAHNINSTTDV
jgi:hypothetical protein